MDLAKHEINTPDGEGWSPILRLCATVRGYSVGQLRNMIKNGADVQVRTPTGRTALHLACGTGKLAFIKPLLDAGVGVNAVDQYGYTALHLAVQGAGCAQGSTKGIAVLLEHGAKIDVADHAGMSPLYLACYIGKVGAVKELCERGANTRLLTPDGAGLIGLVLDSTKSIFQSNCMIMLRALIKAGADVNNREVETGDTEVHKAARKVKQWLGGEGYVEVVKLLIRAGGNPWQRNLAGESALDFLDYTHLQDLQSTLKACIKGNELQVVLGIYSVLELKAFFFNQTKFSKKQVYEMLRAGTPAKEHFQETLALPMTI